MNTIRLKLPVRVIIAGTSNSGKTTLIQQLLSKKNDYFDGEIGKIIFCCKFTKTVPEKIKEICEVNVGLPSSELIERLIESQEEHSIIVIDDLSSEACMSKDVLHLFTTGRHINISVILVLHNLFNKER